MTTIRDRLQHSIAEARDRAIANGALTVPDGTALPAVSIERPARAEHGDFATNLAMQLAPVVRRSPMQIAGVLADALVAPDGVREVTVAPPGFVNIHLADEWIATQVGEIRQAGRAFGLAPSPAPLAINVEFVSANPTGPLTVGNARGAFVGDLLSRVLAAAGHRVTREYYFNDFGAQVHNLGLSVLARRRDEPIPTDGYHGAYVADLAAEIPDAVWTAATAPDADPGWVLGRWASERVRASIEASLERLGVHFDVWKGEGSLHDEGWVQRGVDQLRATGHIFEADGATWFRSTAFGDDKDRVVYRSNGAPTYFASDIGYVAEKFSRGFDHLIYLWGVDHHGTVARVRNAAEALGHDRNAVQMILIAWVRFVRGDQVDAMSKRSGEFVSLDELLDEIGADAARWFFGSRAASSGIDFDIELAKSQSAENPVYYVQYAHARACSILRNGHATGLAPDDGQAAALLRHPAEQALIRRVLTLPEVVTDAAARRETHDITRFCLEVAQLFSTFYRDCRVLSDEPAEADLSRARLALTDAARGVLANGLGMLGISAPQEM